MTYNVFGGTLSLNQSVSLLNNISVTLTFEPMTMKI